MPEGNSDSIKKPVLNTTILLLFFKTEDGSNLPIP